MVPVEGVLQIIRNATLARVVQDSLETSLTRMSIHEAVARTGLGKRQSSRIVSIAKELLQNTREKQVVLDLHNSKLRTILRRGAWDVLSCCEEFGPVHYRDIVRISGLSASTVHVAVQILKTAELIKTNTEQGIISLEIKPEFLCTYEGHEVCPVPIPNEFIRSLQQIHNLPNSCHTVIAHSFEEKTRANASITSIVRNRCLDDSQMLNRFVSTMSRVLSKNARSIIDCAITDRNTWLSAVLQLTKNGPARRRLRASTWGVVLFGEKPRPSSMYSAATEPVDIDKEKERSLIAKGYVTQRNGKLMFTAKGYRMIKSRYRIIGPGMQIKRIETPSMKQDWKLILL